MADTESAFGECLSKAQAVRKLPTPASLEPAVVAETLQGIRRTLGTAQPGKTPLVTANLVKVLAHLEGGLAGVRCSGPRAGCSCGK